MMNEEFKTQSCDWIFFQVFAAAHPVLINTADVVIIKCDQSGPSGA